MTPTLKNAGNSVIRPLASVKIFDTGGKVIADVPEIEPLPILAGSELNQAVLIEKALEPGNYTVKYHIDFQDGGKPTEGVTDLIVTAGSQIALKKKQPPQKP